MIFSTLIGAEGADTGGISGTGETPEAQPRRLTARPAVSVPLEQKSTTTFNRAKEVKQRDDYMMYLTMEETAEYLSMPVSQIERLIQQKKIRALFDGEQYLIYKEQFNTHFEQVEKYKHLLDEWRNEPLKDDIDIKDED